MNIFHKVDKIYCINLKKNKERRKMMLAQFKHFDCLNKVIFSKAYTPDDEEVINSIYNYKVYPIQIRFATQVAITFSFLEVWNDIRTHKYKKAMIVEDDIMFYKDKVVSYSELITDNIFIDNKPFILHLIGTNLIKQEYQDKFPDIYNIKVKYGNGCYIINDIACDELIKNAFPITSPCDDYLHAMKIRKKFVQKALVPILCTELSHYNNNIKNLKNIPRESMKKPYKVTFDDIKDKQIFLYSQNNTLADKLYVYLIKLITDIKPRLIKHNNLNNYKTLFHLSNVYYDDSINYQNGCILGCKIKNDDICKVSRKMNKFFYVLMANTKRERDIFKNHKYKCINITDPIFIYPKFFHVNINKKYKYGFITTNDYEYDIKNYINNEDANDVLIIDSNTKIPNIIRQLSTCDIVHTNDLHIIMLCHGYKIKVIPLDKNDKIVVDYYETYIDLDINDCTKQMYINHDYIHDILPFVNNSKAEIYKAFKTTLLNNCV